MQCRFMLSIISSFESIGFIRRETLLYFHCLLYCVSDRNAPPPVIFVMPPKVNRPVDTYPHENNDSDSEEDELSSEFEENVDDPDYYPKGLLPLPRTANYSIESLYGMYLRSVTPTVAHEEALSSFGPC